MTIRAAGVLVVLLTSVSCGPRDPTSNGAGGAAQLRGTQSPTLLVSNATCDPGPCVPLEIRGFAPKFTVPGQPAWGFVRLGTVTGRTTCLSFPPSWTITVTGPSDTTAITWTVDDPITVSAITSRLEVLGAGREMVPSGSPGWSVTFGGTSPAAALTSAQACTP